MIAVVDYGRGNLFSIGNALRFLEIPYTLAENPEQILLAERVLLPGVGAFGDAMNGLTSRHFIEPLIEVARRGTPLLGICLGMQILAESSDEFGGHSGLGLIPGHVIRLPAGNAEDSERIPNIGWRELHFRSPVSEPFDAVGDQKQSVYFLHSYGFFPAAASDIVATTSFNGAAPAAIVRRGNVVGYQFHPEKSGAYGLELFRAFMSIR